MGTGFDSSRVCGDGRNVRAWGRRMAVLSRKVVDNRRGKFLCSLVVKVIAYFALCSWECGIYGAGVSSGVRRAEGGATVRGARVFGIVVLSHDNSVREVHRTTISKFGRALVKVGGTRRGFTSARRRFISLIAFYDYRAYGIFSGIPINGTHPLDVGSCRPYYSAPLCSTVKFALATVRGRVGSVRSITIIIAVVASNCRGTSGRCGNDDVGTLIRALHGRN